MMSPFGDCMSAWGSGWFPPPFFVLWAFCFNAKAWIARLTRMSRPRSLQRVRLTSRACSCNSCWAPSCCSGGRNGLWGLTPSFAPGRRPGFLARAQIPSNTGNASRAARLAVRALKSLFPRPDQAFQNSAAVLVVAVCAGVGLPC